MSRPSPHAAQGTLYYYYIIIIYTYIMDVYLIICCIFIEVRGVEVDLCIVEITAIQWIPMERETASNLKER